MRLRLVAIAMVLSCALSAPSLAADKPLPADMMAVIQTDFGGFNADNFDLSNSQYLSDVVIIDETPPYRWAGPGANAKWWADFHKLAKTIKLTNYHFSLQKPAQWEITNGRAYVVLPTTFTGKIDGKPFTETGVETYLLVKVGTTWKCQGWAYGRLSVR